MKVAVIGADGQLGTDVCSELERAGHDCRALTHDRIEIADIDSVRDVLGEMRSRLVVNTAAMHHVEECEKDPLAAFRVNALGARNLAIHCAESDTALLHVSTDYVFDGAKATPYLEDDAAHPLNVYGNSKLSGEQFIRSIVERHVILRTSGLYGRSRCRAKGPNFVETMLRLARERDRLRVVDSEILTPTSTVELSRQIVRLAETDCYGLLHATAAGSCSWFEFAQEIFRLAGITVRLEVAGPGEFPMKVPRPTYSVLDNRGLASVGLDTFAPWQEGLREYLAA